MVLPAIGAGTAATAGWLGADVFSAVTDDENGTSAETADAIEQRAIAQQQIAQSRTSAAVLIMGFLTAVVIVIWS